MISKCLITRIGYPEWSVVCHPVHQHVAHGCGIICHRRQGACCRSSVYNMGEESWKYMWWVPTLFIFLKYCDILYDKKCSRALLSMLLF